jgi:hypothetical protein
MSCTHGSEGAGGAAMRLPLPDWLAREHSFRAYRRLPGARRDTALSAATSAEMADLISQAEQPTRTPPPRTEES